MSAEVHVASFQWFCPDCVDGISGFQTVDDAQGSADRHNAKQHTRLAKETPR